MQALLLQISSDYPMGKKPHLNTVTAITVSATCTNDQPQPEKIEPNPPQPLRLPSLLSRSEVSMASSF